MGSNPGSGRFLGGGNGTHSNILAWRILWTGECGRLQSIGSQRVGHNWSNWTHTNRVVTRTQIQGETLNFINCFVINDILRNKQELYIIWGRVVPRTIICRIKYPWVRKIPRRRAWQPTPVFLPGEFHGYRSLVGYSPWNHTQLKQLSMHTYIPKIVI